MRIIVFGPERRVGALVGDNVLDLNAADSEVPSSLLAFIEGGDALLQRAQRAVDQAHSAPDEALQPIGSVKLRAPWPGRRAMMAGSNIGTHISGSAGSLDEAIRKQREIGQRGFWKVHLEPVDPDEPIAKPKRTQYLDYEGEPVVIIGKQVKDARAADIRDLVWGVTLSNDLCIRDEGGNPGARFAFDKNFDGSFTLGPSIVIGEVDFEDLPIETRVNGELRQTFTSKDMIFSFGEMLELGTRDFTFYPGDIISGGTGGGTALDSSPRGHDGKQSTERFLKPGDIVEVSSPLIGTLRHRIV
jgi:2-keto-4-pentenoate hydratase/2-oxohepta-3-ene-1,7-dioic acid hydratase in catechol pathway